MPLFLHQLDDIISRGCQSPGCAHEGDCLADGLYLTQRCHPRTGVDVTYEEHRPLDATFQGAAMTADASERTRLLQVMCHQCQTVICTVALAEQPIWAPGCEHKAKHGLEVRYQEGLVTVACYRCHRIAAVAAVAVQPATEEPIEL